MRLQRQKFTLQHSRCDKAKSILRLGVKNKERQHIAHLVKHCCNKTALQKADTQETFIVDKKSKTYCQQLQCIRFTLTLFRNFHNSFLEP